MKLSNLRSFILLTFFTMATACVTTPEEDSTSPLDGEPDNIERRAPSNDDLEQAQLDASMVDVEEPAPQMDDSSALSTDENIEGAAGPVLLGTGVFTTTTDCGSSAWKSPASGTSHAGIQSCSITWGKETLENPILYWQKVSFQLRDEETDGQCARATVTGMTGYHSECNGVWVTKTTNLSGHHSCITTTLSWGGNQPVSRTRCAPIGF